MLRSQIESNFDRRGAHSPPQSLPSAPAEWARPFGRLAAEVGIPADLATGHREAAALLDPVLAGEVTSGLWDPTRRRWGNAT